MLPLSMFVSTRLVHLSPVDIAIIVFYFALVLTIGFYLRGRANTGEDFFMAGREMTAWVAGLSFLSANLGALEPVSYTHLDVYKRQMCAHEFALEKAAKFRSGDGIETPSRLIQQEHARPVQKRASEAQAMRHAG